MNKLFAVIILVTVSLSGCASIVSDSSQPVSIDTPDCKKAKCRATNSEGVYFVAETPATIVVNKAFGDLTLVCEKNGKTQTSVHKSSANAATFGNILLGGIPGALIDGGTGKGYDYPSHINNNLHCSNMPPTETQTYKPTAVPKSLPVEGKRPNLDEAKKECKELGFKIGTEKFGTCVLHLTGS